MRRPSVNIRMPPVYGHDYLPLYNSVYQLIRLYVLECFEQILAYQSAIYIYVCNCMYVYIYIYKNCV